ncbi:hypothetical protein PRUPE_4G092000 [Prunus persica]|uniref:Uncharacterized protein n=1 Tax=Prunus persica TaxID=3760 RepID=A0A251PI04_PRUPE|nr:hypothetical protein PRUPE_4G092000 [Prunus persica]
MISDSSFVEVNSLTFNIVEKLIAVTTAKIPKSIRQERIPKPNSQDDVAARTTVAAGKPLSSY